MRASERLTLVAVLLLSAVTAAARPDGGALRLLCFLAIAAATVLLARVAPDAGAGGTGRAGGAAGFLRDWFPVGVVLAVFLLLQPIIEAATPWRLDAALAALDARWLAGVVAGWRAALGRPAPFTDAVYLAYASYYLLPIVVAVLAWRRGPGPFERTTFALLLGFYLVFLGYLVLPASGPRLAPDEEARLLGGGAISGAVRAFLRAAESTTLDAFPSGHTAIAVISGALGTRLLGGGRRGRGRAAGPGAAAAAALWAWAGAIVFATVYIHVHYAVDVLAGLALAAFVLAVCPWPDPPPRGE
ncbi:MAG: phosphatase PAP2 family protein [Acidobacteria bacterium]|jgi:membrane-associated phospholipid phosphatase|nr:phosphatase PAP2 family protein [Acidobacteriota bacterium]